MGFNEIAVNGYTFVGDADLSVFEELSKDRYVEGLHTFIRVWTRGLAEL